MLAALNDAAGGSVAEGAVGGGTGMISYEFKGGIGTSSRVVTVEGRRFTVGVLLQANHERADRIAGVPVGQISDLMPTETPLQRARAWSSLPWMHLLPINCNGWHAAPH